MSTATTTRDRGISFTAEMFTAAWEGRKTITRRVVVPTMTPPKLAPLRMEPWLIDGEPQIYEGDGLPMWAGYHPAYPGEAKWFTCPYGGPGWHLWVRETHAYVPATAYRGSGVPQTPHPGDPSEVAIYKHGWDRSRPAARWRSGRFMPKWATRLWLEVIDVRAEPLQAISEADARAEGVTLTGDDELQDGAPDAGRAMSYRAGFRALWDSINAERGYGWASNCWVWRIAFRRVEL